jgi:hypothetical protein
LNADIHYLAKLREGLFDIFLLTKNGQVAQKEGTVLPIIFLNDVNIGIAAIIDYTEVTTR